MPEYIYRCKQGHEVTVVEPMLVNTQMQCSECGARMKRRPQVTRVNWGGLKPSKGELHPEIKHLLETTDQRRDETAAKYGG